MLGECSRIDNFAPDILRSEGLELVCRHHEVGQRIEAEGPVKVPVHWTRVERQGGEMCLAGDCLGEVVTDIPHLGVVDTVPAHLGHDVLPQDDDFLSAELNSGWIGEKLAAVKYEINCNGELREPLTSGPSW